LPRHGVCAQLEIRKVGCLVTGLRSSSTELKASLAATHTRCLLTFYGLQPTCLTNWFVPAAAIFSTFLVT
jgi:hypothetical protein